MNTLIILVCSVFAIANCQDASVISFGPKYIRPNQPYIVALANPHSSDVSVNLTLTCDDGTPSRLSKTLKKQSIERYSLMVPNGVNIESECTFLAVNNGGNINVRQEATLSVARKTLSIFILTDKPIYKPGDIVRFRVVVLDMATKPVNHIDSIQIDLEDSNGESRRQWTQAVLYKGIFAASHRMSSTPALGKWAIKVTANDGVITNEKLQQFEVREYVMPKFVVKVVPSCILLISDKEISLNVESHYTFGGPVRGEIFVQLFTDDDLHVATHSYRRSFDGNGTFRFMLKDELDAPYDKDYVMVRANVSLTENVFNFALSFTEEIPVFMCPYQIELISAVKYYRPGVPYHCRLSVKDHYGVPVKHKSLIVKTDTGVERSVTLDDHGVTSLELAMPDEADSVDISVSLENRECKNIHTIEGLEFTSSQYLQISLLKRNVKDSTVSFIIRSNVELSHLYFLVTSRGNILLAKYEYCYRKMSHMINFKLTVDMTVQSKLVVYTLNSGHLVMDHFKLDYFANEFELSPEEYKFQPDQVVELHVKAEKDSYVALQAIDQGALQLGYEGFGITKAHVFEDLDEYTPDLIEFDPIGSLGLFFRTGFNTHDESKRSKRSTHHARRHTRLSVKPTLLGTDYPESWLWKTYTMNNKKELTISDVLPKTITSWFVTGFALSPTRGLGLINAPVKLTVSKPFYIIANLPYSIKRFEVVRIQVTLFNFLIDSLPTNVTLYNPCGEFEILGYDEILGKQEIVVPYDQPTSVSFLIKAKKLGDIAIKIKAACYLKTDELYHILRVTPESRLHSRSQTEFISLDLYRSQKFNVFLNIPWAADQRSVNIQAEINLVSASFMTNMAQNLSSLFAIPTDTASSNLLAIIPNVVVLDYIKETIRKDPLVEQEAIHYLSTGYTKQLKYRHPNGAFGQLDLPQKKPSIFLTALVANALSMATKHIEIDQTIITDAFSWVKEKQKQNGCFEEVGEIIYEPIQNNSSSFALTAFVVAAIQENNVTAIQFGELVEKATNCLAKNFHSLTNTYDIALATYALSLTGHAKRQDYLNKLVEESHKEGEKLYWEGELQVEITGYALLSFLAQNMHYDAIQVMNWLKERYSTGAFSGVPSSFAALKALGKIAVYLDRRETYYTVRLKSDHMLAQFTVEHSNALIPNLYDLPNDVRKLEIEIEGIGIGFLQVHYQYELNIQKQRASFNLDVKVLDTSTSKIQNLQVCLSYIETQIDDYVTSGVVLVEVFLPGGFVVNENALKDHDRRVKKTDRVFNNTAMFVYYNEVSTEQECFEVTAHRKYQTALHRPSYVVVYDTNDMSKHAIKSYEDVAQEG
ncbi:thioester-containing protein 1 allele S3-like [Aedes albopictus]|uniref:Uncharacterized protein n=1 Tax=Aedes albopictus TaxID=7160 RepID=A0ABM1Y3W2_AEDAL